MLPAGSVTNPPLFDLERSIVVAYDSANAYLAAWRFETGLRSFTLLWTKKQFGCASHMILYPRTGQLVVNDYQFARVRVQDHVAGTTERGLVPQWLQGA